jgi:hypothetical protein
MFGAQEDDSDILSTIEERGSLEKQVNWLQIITTVLVTVYSV